jgi:hypothetical protein
MRSMIEKMLVNFFKYTNKEYFFVFSVLLAVVFFFVHSLLFGLFLIVKRKVYFYCN